LSSFILLYHIPVASSTVRFNRTHSLTFNLLSRISSPGAGASAPPHNHTQDLPLIVTKMPPPSHNVSSNRKKEKKVSVSVTNWMLGGSLLSGISNTSTRRITSLASLDSVCYHLFSRTRGIRMLTLTTGQWQCSKHHRQGEERREKRGHER
jgi:hypothetical protein